MPILRVFPRRTNATPLDDYVAIGAPGLFIPEDISEIHNIRAVFDMLKRQKEKPEFLGGIEAKIVKDWHVQLFREAHAKKIYFAYDTPDDLEPLMNVAKLFKEGGYKLTPNTHGILYCYVLIGYPNDTFEAATQRLETVKNLGICPMAMLYRDFNGNVSEDWRKFQRQWARPAAIYSKNRIDPLTQMKGDFK